MKHTTEYQQFTYKLHCTLHNARLRKCVTGHLCAHLFSLRAGRLTYSLPDVVAARVRASGMRRRVRRRCGGFRVNTGTNAVVTTNMASAKRELITRAQGQSLQWGIRERAPGQEVSGRST